MSFYKTKHSGDNEVRNTKGIWNRKVGPERNLTLQRENQIVQVPCELNVQSPDNCSM